MDSIFVIVLLALTAVASCDPLYYGSPYYGSYTSAPLLAPDVAPAPVGAVVPAYGPAFAPAAVASVPYSSVSAYSYNVNDYLLNAAATALPASYNSPVAAGAPLAAYSAPVAARYSAPLTASYGAPLAAPYSVPYAYAAAADWYYRK